MFSFFKKDPRKKLNRQHLAKLEQAMMAQRNGDMKSFAMLSVEADAIAKKLNELNDSESKV